MKNPIVSITVATHNMGPSLPAALRSALAQDFSSFEILIVEDGSTDGTHQVLRSFTHERIRILRNEKKEGLTACRNRLLEEARGEWISVLDADDQLLSCKLKNHSRYFNDPQVGMIWGRAVTKNLETEMLNVVPPSNYKPSWDLTESYQAVHSATTWRKEALVKAKGYDPKRTLVEDADMYLKVGDHWKTIYCPELAAIKRIDPFNEFRQTSRDDERKILSQELFRHTIYRRYGM